MKLRLSYTIVTPISTAFFLINLPPRLIDNGEAVMFDFVDANLKRYLILSLPFPHNATRPLDQVNVSARISG